MTSAAVGVDFFFFPLFLKFLASGDLLGIGAWSSFQKRTKGDQVSNDDSQDGTDVSPDAARGGLQSTVRHPFRTAREQ